MECVNQTASTILRMFVYYLVCVGKECLNNASKAAFIDGYPSIRVLSVRATAMIQTKYRFNLPR